MIVRPTPRGLPVERVGHGVQEGLDGTPAGFAILGPLRLDLRAVENVGPGTGHLALESRGVVGRVDPGRERDDLHLETLPHRELHPAQSGRLAGRIAVEGQPEAFGETAELAAAKCSVSAVPMQATTGLNPA